ncbi:MAG: VWA domain-containing protein, partial [Deltaproteobacteria bacterium]|nr:VWA domain-containing protein [Deltaproteobacteria bacterium]
ETYTLPLMSAIATSNPTGTEYYNEPLDPANLDRFTLQMKTKGALACRNWEEARTIIDRYDGTAPDMSDSAKITADTLRLARGLSRRVRLPDTVLAAYLKVLHTLRNRHGCTEKNSLLTDRTMLIKVPRMIRALALLEGRKEAVPEDLRVLKYILTFRVPEKVYEQLDDILAEVLQDPAQEPPPPPEDSEQNQGLQGMDDSEGEGQDAEMTEGEGEQDMIDQLLNALEGEGEEAQRKQAAQQQASTPQDGKGKVERIQPQTVEHLDMLMEQISGRLERNWADSEVHPGGSPRSYRRMKTFEEFTDTDPGDTAIWMDRMHPTLPRTLHRKKKHVGGKVVLIRDVSQSMEGRYARWTSSVVTKMIEMVRKKRMRLGYIEFNHVSRKYTHDGRFFTRDYDKIVDQAANVACSGVTNYQYPLRDALNELRRGSTHNKHIIFLTDGEPTQGDWLVREERKQARNLGVSIHTLFIGTTECPEILDILSGETDGGMFLATPDDKGALVLGERTARNLPQTPQGHGTPGQGGGKQAS